MQVSTMIPEALGGPVSVSVPPGKFLSEALPYINCFPDHETLLWCGVRPAELSAIVENHEVYSSLPGAAALATFLKGKADRMKIKEKSVLVYVIISSLFNDKPHDIVNIFTESNMNACLSKEIFLQLRIRH